MRFRFRTVAAPLAVGALCAAALPAQNLFAQRKTSVGLTDPLVARDIGDILTIVVQDEHRVQNEDRVERSNQTAFNARLDQYTLTQGTFPENVLPQLDVRQSRDFDGLALQQKQSVLESQVSVIVIDRLPNGVLVVAGTRVLEIDDEVKTLRISGLVRPFDITSANTVPSSKVADSRVSLTGEGANTRVNSRGPIAALFDTLFWAVWPF